LCAIHAKRVTIMTRDLQLAKRIRGDRFWFFMIIHNVPYLLQFYLIKLKKRMCNKLTLNVAKL
jgi:hypothetical protein